MECLTKTVGNTEVQICYSHNLPSGYGHYKVFGNAYIDGHEMKISLITTNMEAIDAMRGDSDEEGMEAALAFQEDLFIKNECYISEWVAEIQAEEE